MSASKLNFPPPLYLTSPSDQRFVEWLRGYSEGINNYKSIVNGAYTASVYLPGNVGIIPNKWTEILKLDVDQVEGHAIEVYVNASGFDAPGLPILWMKMDGVDEDNTIWDSMGQIFTTPATGNKIDHALQVTGLSSCRCIHAGQLYSVGDAPQYNLGSGDFTLEFWLYAQEDSFKVFTLEFFWYPGYTITFVINTQRKLAIHGGIEAGGEVDDDTVPINEWCHCAFVRKNGVVSGYLDGVKQWEESGIYSIDNGDNVVLYVCSHEANNAAEKECWVDDLKLWNIARYDGDFVPSASTGGEIDIRLLKDGVVIQQKLNAALTSDLNMTHLVDLSLSEDGVHRYTVEMKGDIALAKIGEVSMIARFV